MERETLQERVVSDEAKAAADVLRRDLELEREAREREADELESERQKAMNLQSVLEDFQAGESNLMCICFTVESGIID